MTACARAVHDAAIQAGGKSAYLVPEPLAAALGAGMPIDTPTGNMIVDIGGGTSEAAVISVNGIVVSASVRMAGNKIDDASAALLIDYLANLIAQLERQLPPGERCDS